ncbi:MAG: hypothetical protein GY803_12040 [Chloroflexi bacterium]|nr:hypothetical protein [Chloroflexota bacterium]
MKPYYDAIYLAPHLDDAALSCGGQIFAQTAVGKSILIVTVMAGDPPEGAMSDFIAELHERWELAVDAVAARRAEDASACRALGADYAHWMTPDCIYRQNPETREMLYPTWEDAISSIHPVETALVDETAQKIAELPDHDRMVVPLAVGRHVDHQITQLAAKRALGANLVYYEDYPYVAEDGTLDKVIDERWQAEIIPLRARAIAARVKAIAAFASQMSTFFDDHNDLTQQINAYVKQIGGERLWHRL